MTTAKKFLGKPENVNFLLVGVGGQGAILASNVLAEVGMELGYDVKQAEVHGMSQRGGTVTSQVRWAPKVFSPMIPRGEADFLIAFEKSEAVRFIHHARPDGVVLINNHAIIPVTVTSGAATYPPHAEIETSLADYVNELVWVDGVGEAKKAGNPRASNVVMLGALSTYFDFQSNVWMEVLKRRVPTRYLEVNLNAFEAGRQVLAGQTGN